jgi:hypothetical protein
MNYFATFRKPKTKKLMVEAVEASTANQAIDRIEEKYGPVGSIMVRPKGFRMWPVGGPKRKYDPTNRRER